MRVLPLCRYNLDEDGLRCIPYCSRPCEHGSLCLESEQCFGCDPGWQGQYCHEPACQIQIETCVIFSSSPLWVSFCVRASSRLACSHNVLFTRSSSHHLRLGGSRKDDYGMWVTKMGCYHTGECHGVDSCINCPHGWAGPKCEEVRCLLLPCPAACSLLLPFAALRLSSSLLSMHIDDHRFKLISPPRFCPERTLLITLPVLPLTVLSAYVVACCLDQVPGGLAILIIGLVAGLGNLYIYPPLKRTPMCIFSSWV